MFHQRSLQFLDEPGLADARQTGNEHRAKASADHRVVSLEHASGFLIAAHHARNENHPPRVVAHAETEGGHRAAGGEFLLAPHEIGIQAVAALVALFRFLEAELRNDEAQGLRDGRVHKVHRRRLFGEVGVYQLERVDAFERQMTGQQFIKGDRQGIHVGGEIHPVIDATGLFWRGIGQRAFHETSVVDEVAEFADVDGGYEIDQPNRQSVRADQDVVGLDAAVDDPTVVHGRERLGQFEGDGQEIRYSHQFLAAPPGVQGHAGEMLLNDELRVTESFEGQGGDDT